MNHHHPMPSPSSLPSLSMIWHYPHVNVSWLAMVYSYYYYYRDRYLYCNSRCCCCCCCHPQHWNAIVVVVDDWRWWLDVVAYFIPMIKFVKIRMCNDVYIASKRYYKHDNNNGVVRNFLDVRFTFCVCEAIPIHV